MYIENPKTKKSGIYCAIPQTGNCPNNCQDCFFQSGRSYLEPLQEHLPNMPSWDLVRDRVVRVNDGNDSNVKIETVIEATRDFPMKFYNTAIPRNLSRFPGPVVLTVNPGMTTDTNAVLLDDIPANLMFVRFRTNTWNIEVCNKVVAHYASKEVPIILTFMAYFGTADLIPDEHKKNYIFRKRTQNDYWAISTAAWEEVMKNYRYNKWVYSCGKIEGEMGITSCRHCGNCLREYFATSERLRLN